MAKGLGQIIAQLAMEREKARIDKGEAVPCPLCGHAMEFNGVSWFCYADEREPMKWTVYGTAWHCYADDCESLRSIVQEAWENADPKTRPVSGGVDDYQGITLAAILDDDGNLAVEFCTVRGGNGKTNYKVSWWGSYMYDHGLTDADLPGFIKDRQWIWQDFVPDEIAGG